MPLTASSGAKIASENSGVSDDFVVDIARAIQQRGRIRSRTCFTQRGLHLRRQHEQLASRLHHDLTHIASRGGDDLHRLALGRAANLIAQTSQLIGLSDPRVPANAVLLDEIRDRLAGGEFGLSDRSNSDIVFWGPAGFTTPDAHNL